MLHLPKDVEKYGSIETFSAFPFENYIGSIKKLIRKGEKPLQQIARRLGEYELVKKTGYRYSNNIDVGKRHYNGIVPVNRVYDFQFKILTTPMCRIDIDDTRNNCVLLNDETVVNIMNIGKRNGMLYIIGKKCVNKNDLYIIDENVRSSSFGMKIVSEINAIEDWPVHAIHSKTLKIPLMQGLLICSMIHTIGCFKLNIK